MTAETIVHPVELGKPHEPRVIQVRNGVRAVLYYDEDEGTSRVGIEQAERLDLMGEYAWRPVATSDRKIADFVSYLALKVYMENPT